MTGFRGERSRTLPLRADGDVVVLRHQIRDLAVSLGFDLVTQTKLITAASELGRNTVVHGGGGETVLDVVRDAAGPEVREGIRLTFVDQGPGIPDLDRAMTGGWSSGSGLGLGLPGSRRLVHEFDLNSVPGKGTRVTVVVWRRVP